MSVIQKLNGWNVGVQKISFTERGENGLPREVEGFALVFTELIPPTQSQIIFEMRKEVADFIVREITGVIIPGLHTPDL